MEPTVATAYMGTPNAVNPTATQGLFPDWLLNPIGSDYAAQFNEPETIHLKRIVFETIVKNYPAQFNIFRILMSKPVKHVPSDEFTWTETNWPRPILKAGAGQTAGQTEVITLTPGGSSNVTLNDVIVFGTNNAKGNVIAVDTTGNTITVTAFENSPNLPTVNNGDIFTIESPMIADGMNTFYHFDRLVTATHSNLVSSGQRNARWTTKTAMKYKDAAQTDYFEKDAMLRMELAQQDVFSKFFNGTYGNVDLPSAQSSGQIYKAKSNWGVYPFMVYSGSQHAVSSPTTIVADFKELAFNTNYKNVNDPRFVLGTERALSTLETTLKDPVRYNPNDKIYDMGLDEYKVGKTMKFVPMTCPLFEKRSGLFPAFFENILLVLDLSTIDPVTLNGYEIFEHGNTSALYKRNGGNQDWIDYWVEYNISMQMTNTDSSYFIQLAGM